MSTPEPTTAKEHAQRRIWEDSAEGITVAEADTSGAHSAEAMRILREEGVTAYQEFLAEQ